MTVAVRRATRADLALVLRLHAQLKLPAQASAPEREPLPAEVAAFEEIDADPRQELLLLEHEGTLAATATLSVLASLSGGGRPRAYLDNVVVDAALRGQGLGAALVLHCLARARARGARRLSLLTNLQREGAHRFYEMLGFSRSHVGYVMELG